MPGEANKSKAPLAILAVLLLLCAIVAAWFIVKSRHEHRPPIAVVRVDSIDETNRVATISDGGSQDPDGTITSWRIAWGDGKEENLSTFPRKVAHTYAAEGKYTISFWCADNLGSTSSPPAMVDITLDFLARQKALELSQAEAKREADRLKEEAARKEAERLEQERKQKELAALEAQKARELEEKRKADEAELARKNAKVVALPPRNPLAAGLLDDTSSRTVIFTPRGFALGEFLISKEKTDGIANDGNVFVILTTRCVNFPHTPIPTADWQIDETNVPIRASRIRASLSPGEHQVTARLVPPEGAQPTELKADITVGKTGECVVMPRK